MEERENTSETSLNNIIQPVADALYVINGKWKLPILISITSGNHRFGDISRSISKMTDRMLSKELKELEANLLVKRTVIDDIPVRVIYSITDHGKSLHDVITELSNWGIYHRKIINEHSRKSKSN